MAKCSKYHAKCKVTMPKCSKYHAKWQYMFLRPIPLSVIGDPAHGELSINGVRIGDKGPPTKVALNNLVEIASQKGIVCGAPDVPQTPNQNQHRKVEYPTNERRQILLQGFRGRRYRVPIAHGREQEHRRAQPLGG